jgi:hypothetical protein
VQASSTKNVFILKIISGVIFEVLNILYKNVAKWENKTYFYFIDLVN